MKLGKAVVVLALLLVAGCAPASTPAPEQEPVLNQQEQEDAIVKSVHEYAAAWLASDAARLGRLYTADAIFLAPDSPSIVGADAIGKFNQAFFDQYTPKDFSITPEETEISGDLGFTRGTFSYAAAPKAGGAVLSDRGKYIIIVKRQPDGSWKWFRDIDNSDGETPAVPERN